MILLTTTGRKSGEPRTTPLLSLPSTEVMLNNSTKATPSLSADILGDWREEFKALQQAGVKNFEVVSPVPHHQIMHLLHRKPSPVRVFTLAGGLLGLAIGWGITIGPLSNFHLHVGGKPLLSIPPFGVVAYICTILFGALATVAGMIINARLPNVNVDAAYDARLSSDHFGLRVYCTPDEAIRFAALLSASRAVEIQKATP